MRANVRRHAVRWRDTNAARREMYCRNILCKTWLRPAPRRIRPHPALRRTVCRGPAEEFCRPCSSIPGASPHQSMRRTPSPARFQERPSTSDFRCSPPCGSAPHRAKAPYRVFAIPAGTPRTLPPCPGRDRCAWDPYRRTRACCRGGWPRSAKRRCRRFPAPPGSRGFCKHPQSENRGEIAGDRSRPECAWTPSRLRKPGPSS